MENESEFKRRALGVLKRFYGYDSFYPIQYSVINHVMAGRDALVLMPTGGGKSLCYQIPALLSDGCAIVVSPLLALMTDQVDALRANGIPAAAVNSQQTEADNRTVIENVYAGRIKLLYISPERLLTELESWSAGMNVSLIAVDEAHCISQWGHDFRPEYTQLSVLKRKFPNVPIMALTATADKLTRDDIRRQLLIPDAQMFITSFDRPNISLNVVSGLAGKDKIRRIANFIDAHPGQSGIVYCLSRKSTETLAERLKSLGFNARAFHAAMPTADKNAIQRAFINDDVQIICATVAFGMGIDKSNVRWVIHYNMPKNIESYYQEIGRAGRDGMPAEALMFYSFGDMATLMKFASDSGQSAVNVDKLRRMQQYAESAVCRRRTLLSYFNERYDHDCGNCDVCRNPPERIDGTVMAQMALSAMARTGEQVGLITVIDILRGSHKAEISARGFDRLKTFGVGRDLSFAAWNSYMLQMLQMGLIDIAYNEDNHLKITEFGRDVLFGRKHVQLSKFYYEAQRRGSAKKEKRIFTDAQTSGTDRELFEHLKQVRLAIAKAKGLPPYMVFSDKVLNVMSVEKPTTKAQFGTLYGVGEHKMEQYWHQFTSAIIQWQRSHQ